MELLAFKRQQQPSDNMIDLLSEETLIEILSYLNLNELSVISRVSTRFNRLFEDPQLWKTMFHLRWGDRQLKYPFLPALDQRTRPPHPSSLAILGSQADRKGKGREQAVVEQVQLGYTWKNLCRISLNWQTGSAHITRLIPPVEDSRHQSRHPSIIVRFYRSLIFTASRVRTSSSPPVVNVYQLQRDQESQDSKPQPIGYLTSAKLDFSNLGMVGISEIRVDERCNIESVMDELPFSNQNSVILAVFYTTGQFACFQIGIPLSSDILNELDVTEVYASTEMLVRSGQGEMHHQTAEVARLYYPLLVTCSTDFFLRFYELRQTGDNALEVRKLRFDMRSQTCFWPLSINLTALDIATNRFRLIIVYPTPFYPSAWTIGLQEFELSLSPTPRLLSTRHATARPHSNIKLGRQSGRPTFGSSPVSGIEYAEPNTVVVARADNNIDTFEYRRWSSSQAPELLHRQTLFGHTSRVAAVAVNSSGRCVSAGQDGLNVWELTDGGQVSGPPVQVGLGWTGCRRVVDWVGFDTEKIVGVFRAGTYGGGEGESGQVMGEEVRVLSFA
ncbi:hypothetical protein CROQUDRAFT_664885 [Cronartium quercuum f. sp. fusiforme G11]|uniref:F-box domain-containing protein n=1 Tax=Cronartium quercuum f. sp. fusiforme G11 TaxID=708437 RepID=A0A9P6NAY9_9BASI|nr:hypothetical protein CROQUDRAFT_664885 [Cronartium quercuum f. sp. fusiforme G11]